MGPYRSLECHNKVERAQWRKMLRSFGNVRTLVRQGLIKELSRSVQVYDGLTHRGAILIKRDPHAANLEVLLAVHELQEVRNEKCELVEERDLELLEEGGMNSRKKCLQVSGFAFERKQRRLGSAAACVMMGACATYGSRWHVQ